MNYRVDFTLNKAPGSKVFTADNAGTAFAKCLKENPTAVLVKAWVQGVSGGYCEFDPPAVQRAPRVEPRPARALKPDEKDGVMPFYDEVLRK